MSVLGKRKATHMPLREEGLKKPAPVKPPQDAPEAEAPMKQALKLSEQNSYQVQQEEHLRTVERERKYQANKKIRETEDAKRPKKKKEEVEEADSDDGGQAVDMRREDAELEKILRDYNNEARQEPRNVGEILEKPLDLPFYKGIQLPTHLKWVSVFSVTKICSLSYYHRNKTRASSWRRFTP